METERFNPSRARLVYVVNITAAFTASGIGGAAFGLSQQLKTGQPLLWEGAGVVAELAAVTLTIAAMKHWRQMRHHPSTRARLLRNWFKAKLDAAVAFNQTPEIEDRESTEPNGKAKSPVPNPLDAERQRLRQKGLTKAEISQIMIARETASQTGMNGAVHGVLGGVLSNLAAVMTYARNFIPGLAVDLARMLHPKSPLLMRMQAASNLVMKAVVITVLAYIVTLEVEQLRASVNKARAEACIERQKNAINFMTLNELATGNNYSDLDKECRQL